MLKNITSMLLAVMMVCATFASTVLAVQPVQLPSSAQPLIEKINAVFQKLDEDEKNVVREALDALYDLGPADKLEVTNPVWQVIDAKFEVADRDEYPEVTEVLVSELFLNILSVLYGNAEPALTEAYQMHLETIKQLVQLSGKAGLDDVTFEDLVNLVSDLEDEVENQLETLSWGSLITNGVNQSFNTIVGEAFDAVLESSSNPLAEAFDELGIDGQVLIDMKDNLETYIDPDHDAAFYIAVGYLRNNARLVAESGTGSLNAQLIVLGHQVPGKMLKWEWVGGSTSINVAENGQVTLSGSSSATATIKASLVLLSRELKVFEGSVTLSPSSSGGDSGGGSPGGEEQPATEQPTPQVPENLDRIEEIVIEVDEIAVDADPAEVAEKVKNTVETITSGVQEAVAIAQTALAQAAAVKANVSVENGVAKAVIDEAALNEQIATIQKLAEEMAQKLADLQAKANAKLAELSELAGTVLDEAIEEVEIPSLKIELVIDPGEVVEEEAEAEISETIIEAVKAAGITHVAFNVNGAKVSLPASELSSTVSIKISHLTSSVVKNEVSIASVQAAASDTTYIRTKAAAELYDMQVTVGGQEVRSFAEPVIISIPVTNAAAYDKELLTLVSVDEDNEYTYFTGEYNAETGHVEAAVYSLTGQPYTVVETAVTFDDLASVQSWAGREIAVVAGKGIINGKKPGVFDPTASVTRAEFAKMIVLAYNLYDPTAEESFNDVNDSDWFKPYIASAVKHGLINGKGNGRFDPYAPITRAEMATIAARTLQNLSGVKGVSNVDGALSQFADAGDIVSSLRAGTALAARYGIVVGSDGKFNPNSESTRAAAAVVIYRLINVN